MGSTITYMGKEGSMHAKLANQTVIAGAVIRSLIYVRKVDQNVECYQVDLMTKKQWC